MSLSETFVPTPLCQHRKLAMSKSTVRPGAPYGVRRKIQRTPAYLACPSPPPCYFTLIQKTISTLNHSLAPTGQPADAIERDHGRDPNSNLQGTVQRANRHNFFKDQMVFRADTDPGQPHRNVLYPRLRPCSAGLQTSCGTHCATPIPSAPLNE